MKDSSSENSITEGSNNLCPGIEPPSVYKGEVPFLTFTVENENATPPLFTVEESVVGKLWGKGGKLSFTGNAEESAKVFLDVIIKKYGHLLLPSLDDCYKEIPFPEDAKESAFFVAGLAEMHKYLGKKSKHGRKKMGIADIWKMVRVGPFRLGGS